MDATFNASAVTNRTRWQPADDVAPWNVVEGVLFTVIAVVGFLVNVFIVVAVLASRKLRRRVADVLCCHLAAVGIAWCALLLPANVTAAFAGGWPLRATGNDGGLCGGHGYAQAVLLHIAVWTIAMLGWNKYRTISVPMQHVSSAIYRQRVAAILIPTWATGLTLGAAPLVSGSGVGRYGYGRATATCALEPSPTVASVVYSVAVALVGFLLPVGVAAHSYLRIYSIARWHRKRIALMSAVVHVITLSVGVPMSGHALPEVTQATGNRSPPTAAEQCWDRKTSRNVLGFVAAMILCYAPHYVIVVSAPVVHRSTDQSYSSSSSSLQFPVPVEALASIVMMASPVVNGFIYGVRNRAMIRSFRSFIRPPSLGERLQRHLVSNV